MFYTAGWRRRFRLNQLTTHENYVASDIGHKSLDKATTLEDLASINSSSSDMKSADLSNIYFMAETADNLKLTSKDFAYPDSPRADSLSLWSDATGEPLVDDSKSDVIPMSVRPLDGSFLRKMNSNRSNSFDMGSITEELPSDFEEATSQCPETPETETGNDYGLKDTSHRRGKQSFESNVSSSGKESPSNESLSESLNSSHTTLSIHSLPPLQTRSMLDDFERLDPVLEDDPASFELVSPPQTGIRGFSVETRAEDMFSRAHLEEIFADPSSMLRFTQFLSASRPSSIPLLIYYLDALKSLKAIKYANAIAEALSPISGLEFTGKAVDKTINDSLEKRAQEAFDVLVNGDLPAYISHVFIQVVNVSLYRRVTGTLPFQLRQASEGLGEVFCLTDPAREDNPIIFASEEFHRTTQYGVDYSIGRNCRFLQGPNTSKDSIRRLKEAIKEGNEVNEVFVNYRRDGSAFMNLLTVAPLFDSRGNIRYFIGAQVDVTGLCKDCTDLESLSRLLDRKNALNEQEQNSSQVEESSEDIDEFQELVEMFNDEELDIVRKCGGRMHSQQDEKEENKVLQQPRLHVRDLSVDARSCPTPSLYTPMKKGKSSGLFRNYLLVRPYPSLRILFASPALRTPGMLQSPFLSRIGGSSRVREELTAALASGRGVTAKVRWVSGRATDKGGAPRWVHCTPLLGKNGTVGVWMVVIIDDEGYEPVRKFKEAPPVANGSPLNAESLSRCSTPLLNPKRASLQVIEKIKAEVQPRSASAN